MTSIVTNNFVQEYLNANKALVRSMVVKSNYAVYATNKKLTDTLGEQAVDSFNPQSWKYYMNVAGLYHVTDEPMHIISLDTQEEILFNPENLVRHTATAAGYQHGTRFYYALVNRFPHQKFLINCILHPCDIRTAIDADDGTILSYDTSLVEKTETTLVMELEGFIKLFNKRWDVQAFSLTDAYYGYAQRFILGQELVAKLLNLRTKRCKTEEVHSFHLREYLASHQRLDRWLPYLTRDQALWLYRNIVYLERNAGQHEIFQALLHNLLDARYIPLTDYSIRQLSTFWEDGLPVVMARRVQLSKASPASQKSLIALEELFDKELKTTFDNSRWFEIHGKTMDHATKVAYSSVLQTKDLESFMQDLSLSVPDSLPEVMLRQWVAMTHMGLYNTVIHFQDPKTAVEHSMLSKDAIIYMLYLTMHMEKQTFEKIPPAINVKFRRHPRPQVSELKALIEPGMEWLNPIAEELVSGQPNLSECFSVSMFNDMTYQVYLECQKHWKMLADCHDKYARGVLEAMILKLFGWCARDFGDGESVETWRLRNEIPVYDRSYDEAKALIQEIFERATGYRIDKTKTLRHIQKALLELFAELSSYSIQFIREINDSEVLMGGGNGLRLDKAREEVKDHSYLDIHLEVMSLTNEVTDSVSFGDNLPVEVHFEPGVYEETVDAGRHQSMNFFVESDESSTLRISNSNLEINHHGFNILTGQYEPIEFSMDSLSQDTLKKLSQLELFK